MGFVLVVVQVTTSSSSSGFNLSFSLSFCVCVCKFMDSDQGRSSEIVFFDVETTMPDQIQRRVILEFAAIIVCPKKLKVVDTYSTFVRPTNSSLLNSLTDRSNGITRDAIISAPTFRDIADRVYDLLHGRIWAGHNILRFDCVGILEAFLENGRPVPEPRGTIDTLDLLTQKFGRRAGDMKELSSGYTGFLEPSEVSISLIESCAVQGNCGPFQSMRLLHRDEKLQLFCSGLRVKYGICPFAHRQLSFVVEICPALCNVLDACENKAQQIFEESGNMSDWWPLMKRKQKCDFPSVKLRFDQFVNAEIYLRSSNGTLDKLEISRHDAADELDGLLVPGAFVEAYLSLDPFDYKQNAGVHLTVKRLIITDSK